MSAPKVLGVDMALVGTHRWALSFAGAHVSITPSDDGWFYWACCGAVAREQTIEVCVSAIERELLAIRNAIPEGKP